ncbi:WXG100 family type VII secretion target [Nocardia africana]|uniref:WXG100 family type VII secretion target n=1 Tax=Nocardia africana TaxID=134964 RepID=A0A378WR74_9NOCA|nr:WXG100 family type VII secretion target [Nocardia africana]MCC3314775.1 WXG100 family type VII secretion target [Nocardia africana]SUA42944.1 WXG100 family type VII secretion target [Nocardia africana]
MADRVNADPAAMHATADWLQGTADELADVVDTHMRAVWAFLGGDWQGTAAGSHEGPWSEWEEGARRIIGSFFADVGALRSAAGVLATSDSGSAESIGRAGATDSPGPQ